MKKIYLAFMWHMHQPYYKDDLQNEYKMPWVFLHAIKDYYELPNYLVKFNKIRATFNLVPSLIEQLEEYSSGFYNDSFLSTLAKDVSLLTPEEREMLSKMLFFSNLKTMINPLPRYRELYNKKNGYKSDAEFAASLEETELLDLEVLFLLSWCCNALREDGFIKSLLKRGRDYSESDKKELLVHLNGFISKIIPFYKKLQDEGRIEISTTHYYHPILPLLLDKNSAKEADSNAKIPKLFADFRSDAVLHVESAIKKYESVFGKKPSTFWPAEGSISKEALELLSQKGVKYVGADEDVFYKSSGSKYRSDLYKRYIVGTEHKIGVLFRDKPLSDLIGFTFSSKPADEAASDFISRLEDIYKHIGFNGVVSVILDGENAWEYYENNGKDFFEALYKRLDESDWCECVTFSQVFESLDIETGWIETIKPGSWIYGTFSTWMGHEEKNKAWELLSETKNAFESQKSSLSEQTLKAAQKELMIAEGSDWFWWYGDDHYTPQASEFDGLFRKHLLNVYKLIGKEPPVKIFEPISKVKIAKLKQKPKNYISPVIDGAMTDFYEWLGAGSVELNTEFSAMDSSGFHFEELYWGFDEDSISFALKGRFAEFIDKGYELCMEIVGSKAIKFLIPFVSSYRRSECMDNDKINGYFEFCVGDVFEITFPKACLECGCEKLLQVSFEIQKNGKVIERAPLYGSLELEVNEKFLEDWYI